MLEEKAQDLMINVRGLLPLIVSNALNVLGAILILLIGLWLAGKADQVVVRMLSRAPHFDAMLKSFFGSLARYLVLTVTVLAVLSQFGIQTTSLIAVLGAAGLAIAVLKSDLIKAVHTAFDAMPEKRPQAEQQGGSRGDGAVSAPRPS